MVKSRPHRAVRMRSVTVFATAALAATVFAADKGSSGLRASAAPPPPIMQANFPDPTGVSTTISTTGNSGVNNPFFASLGTNGRACVTCHQPGSGYTITPQSVQALFAASQGTAPLFRPVDGAVSPNANVSTLAARRAAYNMLLTKALICIHLPMPTNANYTLVSVSDPYGYASAAALSLFRRPLPTTNLRFLTEVMWDGRGSIGSGTLTQDLLAQADNAVETHEQGSGANLPILQSILGFEGNLYSAQTFDNAAGPLTQYGAEGGPAYLSQEPFFVGINDSAGENPTGAAFNPDVFTLYANWANAIAPTPAPPPPTGPHPGAPPPPPPPTGPPPNSENAAQAAVARGENIFDTRPVLITGVAGLNDVTGETVIAGTCSSCHDTPEVGNRSEPTMLNIGIADGARRTADLPLYVFRSNATGQTISTTDPGLGLITGKFADIGKFKIPVLRNLAARAPYFHNGSAADLDAVVNFYNQRFDLNLTAGEHSDLVAFLQTL